MSKYIMIFLMISFSVNAFAEKLPLSIRADFPNSSRAVEITFNDKNISYIVSDKGQSKTDKKVDNEIYLEIVKKWDDVLSSLKKVKNDFVCMNSIEWTVVMSDNEKKVVCKDKEVTRKLGDFQKSIQMLMVQ